AILPLVKKDGLPELAERIYQDLRFDFNVFIEDKDSIGKRYRRMDALGTPFCVTADHDSLTNGDVTLRHRDSMEQERISIEKLSEIIRNQTSMNNLLKSL
ncbi:MAG: His/Gly/Thr/Pro-type tRNA ligase C-terminal domain-containing protein, partial [Bacteroidota bacterium]|nr:His/Gly/Thr/Pro-type tRNA ligase C-terminal domain-containing protein [Bacteroidota bacterium]